MHIYYLTFSFSQLKLGSVIDQNYSLGILQDTKKARAKVPDFLPANGTVRDLLKSCLDLRAVPKLLFLRALVEYTSVVKEKRRLEELCSKQVTGNCSRIKYKIVYYFYIYFLF